MMVLTDGVDPTVNDLPLFGREWRGAGVAVPVFGLRSEQVRVPDRLVRGEGRGVSG